jgi:hypothetical protein
MRHLQADLRASGFWVWTDESLTPGTPSWKAAIEGAIEQAAAVVVILSPDAKRSEWVERELDYARTVGVRVFPVLARGNQQNAIPLELINAQWIDIRPGTDYTSQFSTLVRAVADHINQVSQGTSPPEAMPAPPRKLRAPSEGRRRFPRVWIGAGALALVVACSVVVLLVASGIIAGIGGGFGAAPSTSAPEPTASDTPEAATDTPLPATNTAPPATDEPAGPPTEPPPPEIVELYANADSRTNIPFFTETCEGGEECPPRGEAETLLISYQCTRGDFCATNFLVVHFDLSPIPDGVVITEAVLSLFVETWTGFPIDMIARQATAPWTEEDVAPDPACDTTQDITARQEGQGWQEWDVTEIVQQQYANPTTNHGVCVTLAEGENQDSVTFTSREGSSTRVRLTVTYQP